MMIRKELLAGVLALTLAGGAAYAAGPMTQSQTSSGSQMAPHSSSMSPSTTGQSTSSSSQLSLTSQQKQQIFQATQNLPKQSADASSLTPGSKVPTGVNLSPMPQQAQEGNSALQSAQVAKLQNGDVIVADSSKMVQAVITPADANSTTGQGSSGSMGSSSSSSSGMSSSPGSSSSSGSTAK